MRARLVAPLAAFTLALSACGGGGGVIGGDDDDDPPSQCSDDTCGQVVIGLTAADGDFLSYTVDVVSIELEMANGDTIETLPTEQRVDFADLVEVTEFVTAATIPNGTYVGATVRLNYTEADVTVEVAGLPTEAVVVDENGATLGEVNIELTLDDADHVVIAPGVPALLQLDFDLAATHDVDTTAVPAIAVADPFLIASIEPLDEREFRLRGPKISLDEDTGTFVVDLRPFNQHSARHGEITVHTTASTEFDIFGDIYVGAAGLAQLASFSDTVATVAQGAFDVEDREFTAERVLVGRVVPGEFFDAVIGTVVAREANTAFGTRVFLRSGTVIRADEEDEPVIFVRGNIEVIVSIDTRVSRDDGETVLSVSQISVGSRITAIGDLNDDPLNLVLDAGEEQEGYVRVHLARVSGEVVNATAGQIDLELFAINGRDPLAFDFDGTGTSILTDADPLNYEIDTGGLDTTDFDVGDPARAFGFVTPFGFAPPDFEARTLVDFEALRALLGVGYGLGGTDEAFLSMNDTGLVLDTANPDLGLRRFLKIGGRIIDITTLDAPITIEPAASGRMVFAIARLRQVEVFSDFVAFEDALAGDLGGGSTMVSLTTRGLFHEDETTLTVNYMAVSVRGP